MSQLLINATKRVVSRNMDGADSLPTDELVDRIVRRYHNAHRHGFPILAKLAACVEATHVGHAEVPAGLADLLNRMHCDLELHMCKEEHMIFPLMVEGDLEIVGATIAMMLHDHEDHVASLERIETLTSGCTPPADACGSWIALYKGMRSLIDDLKEHIRLENDILFSRFQDCRYDMLPIKKTADTLIGPD